MNESKELLEATLKGLEEKVSQLNDDIMMKKKELEDINKPEMTEEMYGKLESCIIEGIQDALGNLDAGDIDFQPCGGTHVYSTKEIGEIKIGKIENKGRMNRRVNILLND